MPTPAVYTDFLNASLDNLTAKLGTIVGLSIVNDVRNANPPCVLVNPPTIDTFSRNVFKVTYTLHVLGLGPGNLDGERNLLSQVAKLLKAGIGITTARPTQLSIGAGTFIAYELQIPVESN